MRRFACLMLALLCFLAPALAEEAPLCCEDADAIYAYEDLLADANALAALGVGLQTIGESVDGRPLVALSLGTGDACALVMAGVHGNENANPALLMRGVTELWRRALDGDEQVEAVLKRCTLVVIPCVNPDGYADCIAYVEKGRTQSVKSNRNQVNLNRNFPTPCWGNAKDDREKDYAGSSAGSEPETQAVAALMRERPFSAMLDIHSKGRQVYCGKGGFVQEDLATGFPVEALDRMTYTLAERLLPEGYRVRPQAAASRDGGFGSTTDYAFSLGYPGVTMETVPMDEKGPITPKLIDREYRLMDMPGVLLRLCEAAEDYAGALHP